jgi:hypothetical protein
MYKHNARTRTFSAPRYSIPEPSFRERRYKRPLIYRLRPFTWFLIALLVLAVVGTVVSILYRTTQTYDANKSLMEWTTMPITASPQVAVVEGITATVMPETVVTSTQVEQAPIVEPATVSPTVTAVVTATIRATATQTPTYDISGAPWRDQLVKQSDNTMQAPEEVQARIRNELGEYYHLLRDLSFAEYSTQRDTILNKYFTGTSLKQMQRTEANRTQYLVNRAGTITIQVRDFSSDGYAATIGIRASGWVNDVYDTKTGKLLVKDRLEKDTFTIVRIIFERVSNRWKFATVKMVTEVTKP